MEITYKTKKLKKVCTIASEAEKFYGFQMAEKIHLRIDQITAADRVEDLIKFRIGDCHPLRGSRQNQYAMSLVHPYRLIFKKIEDKIKVCVLEIVDYH